MTIRILDLLRRAALAIKKPFSRRASLNFSPNIPDFDCKICLASRKNNIFSHSKPPTATSLLKTLMAITVLLSLTACIAQIKNAKTESVKIYGNCGMCEITIEKTGNIKKVAEVDWNKDTKMATLTYDASKTNIKKNRK